MLLKNKIKWYTLGEYIYKYLAHYASFTVENLPSITIYIIITMIMIKITNRVEDSHHNHTEI